MVQQSFRVDSNKLKSVSAMKSIWKFVLLCKMVRPVSGVTCYKVQHHFSYITFVCNRVMVLSSAEAGAVLNWRKEEQRTSEFLSYEV